MHLDLVGGWDVPWAHGLGDAFLLHVEDLVDHLAFLRLDPTRFLGASHQQTELVLAHALVVVRLWGRKEVDGWVRGNKIVKKLLICLFTHPPTYPTLMPINRRTSLANIERTLPTGERTTARRLMGGTIIRATISALETPKDLGMSSPKTRVTT